MKFLLMLAAVAPEAMPSSAVPAKPLGNPSFWVLPSDYPADALRQMVEGTTAFQVTVDGMGSVAKCDIVESSGSPSLDAQTCTVVARRARFSPAKDAAGLPVQGTYQNRIRW
ncbi:MAG: energy transducer TonB, partial [Sphingopyxis sp.]|nr:energy transducer TonB [Sphingopyxis sp.]